MTAVKTEGDDALAREEACSVYKKIEQAGLTSGSAGNVSLRHGENMLISPSGADAATICPEHFVLMSLGGDTLSAGIPSSEWALHAGLYKAGKGAAVIHAHPDHCSALSCLRQPIPAFHYMVAAFGGSIVPCAPYATFGTAALAANVVATLDGYSACLMANHGMICVEQSLAKALSKAIKLEVLARQFCLAKNAGDIVLLAEAEMQTVRQRYERYGKSRLAIY
jgi:L-fuculose-phosphate aldolase